MVQSVKVGFVCGAWELLHPGHLMLLKDAREHCDHLVVGLHGDPSQERPEKNRPVEGGFARKLRLEGCRWVDEVETYRTEADLVKLLERLRPHVRILGTDYQNRDYTGQELDIPIHWHKRDHGFSSSRLREQIYWAERAKRIGREAVMREQYEEIQGNDRTQV